ncbi:MAG TPA: PAS domain S-box protein, partial [Desulfobaccales bacterium]
LWNPAAARIFGWSEAEVLGRPTPSIPEDNWPETSARIQRELAGESQSALQLGRLRKDGTLIDVQLWTAPLRNARGEIVGDIGIIADISQRQQMEEALKASEANYRTIFNAVDDGIAVVDLETGNFLDVNQKWCQMTGFSPEEARDLNVAALCLDAPPYTAADAMRWIMEASKEKPQLFEFQAKTKEGRHHWVEVNLRRAVIGGRERLLTVVRDISQRKRTEQELRASEAKYRNLVEQIPAVTYIAGLDNLFSPFYISPQIEAILGFTPEEWLADPEMFKKQIHVEDRDRVLTELLLSYAAGGPFAAEYRLLSKNGRVVWVRDESRAVYDSEGRPLFMQGVLLDITKRKKGEEALREANNKLKALVQASPLAIVGLNLQGKVISWNPAAERIFGWRANEVIGRPHPIAPEDMRPEFKHLWQRVLQGEELLGLELRHQRIDGSLMDVSLSTAPLYDGAGRLVGSMGVFEDITARKSTAEALRESETRFRAMFEGAPIGMALVDLKRTLLKANPAMQE